MNDGCGCLATVGGGILIMACLALWIALSVSREADYAGRMDTTDQRLDKLEKRMEKVEDKVIDLFVGKRESVNKPKE